MMYTYMKIVVLLNLIGIALWYDSFCLKGKYPTQTVLGTSNI